MRNRGIRVAGAERLELSRGIEAERERAPFQGSRELSAESTGSLSIPDRFADLADEVSVRSADRGNAA